MRRPEGRFFIAETSGATMQRHQRIVFAIAALLVWLGHWLSPANATPHEPDPETAEAGGEAPRVAVAATWLSIEARDAAGTSGPAAVLFGVAQERGRSNPATLQIDCFAGLTTVHIDTVGLSLGSSAIAVRHSLDGGPFVQAAWQVSADGHSLELSADHAIAFLTGLYGRTELRLAVVRPLSVPFVLVFAVAGAEPGLSPVADRCHWSDGPAIGEAGR